MNDDIRPYKELACAIVERAILDYREAAKDLKYAKQAPKRALAMKTKIECMNFFKSDWFKILVDIDPNYIIEKLKEEERNL